MRVLALIVLMAALGAAWYWRDRLLPIASQWLGAPSDSSATGATPASAPSPTRAASSGDAAAAQADEKLTQEATAFVESLTETEAEPIRSDNADHFIRADQPIELLPEGSVEETTMERVLADPSLRPDTPITVVKQIEQIEIITPERLIAESAGDLERIVSVLQGPDVVETTVREALEQHALDPSEPISIVKQVRYYEVTTPAELALEEPVQGEEVVGIIRKPYRLEAATMTELLVEQEAPSPDAIFYVRTVRPSDHQGIWGIVQAGLIENFARGIAVRRGEQIDTYQVEIPILADEVLPNASSSFLGRLIHEKTEKSYVYNFRHQRMGRNPHELYPGQEIVIVKFAPSELIAIYKHFIEEGG